MGRGKDLKKRKPRSDRKYKRKRNRAGNLVPYIPKRSKQDDIRVWFFHAKRMSKDGYRNWSPKVRGHIKPIVYYPVGKPISVSPQAISSIEGIEELAVNTIGFEGRFYFKMPCHSKNRFHVSYKKKALIDITEHEDGLRAKVIQTWNLKRYWFWRNR